MTKYCPKKKKKTPLLYDQGFTRNSMPQLYLLRGSEQGSKLEQFILNIFDPKIRKIFNDLICN